jgi:hypothetical protein
MSPLRVVLGLAVVVQLIAGCDQPPAEKSPSAAVPAVPLVPPAPTVGGEPGNDVALHSAQVQTSPGGSASATQIDEVERTPAKSAGMTASLKTVAFLDANRVVVKLQDELKDTLLSVVDDATAEQAAARLPSQVDAWETAQKSATALFLTLSDSEKNAVLGLSADEIVAKTKPGDENMMQIMRRLARSPQRPILSASLTKFRDSFLSQHSIYAPRLARERMAKELGSIGSPLPE